MPRTASDQYALEASFALERTWNTKFGYNPDVDTGAEVIEFSGAGFAGWLTTAATVRIRSGGNANDTAAGSGAREVTVVGLDQNGALAVETIATAGASASSATTTTFLRINRAFVSACGTFDGGAAADILIETSGGTLMTTIQQGKNQTQQASYCVPANSAIYVYEVHLYVSDNSALDVLWYQRGGAGNSSAPFEPRRVVNNYEGLQGSFDIEYHPPRRFGALTDVWFEASGGTSAEVSAEFGFEEFLLA